MRWLAIGTMGMLGLAAPAQAACGRACLDAALDRYLGAMIAHAPARAGLAKNAALTENAVRIGTDAGLWRSATGLGAFQRRYADPAGGRVAYYGLIDEGKTPAIAIVRLHVRSGKVDQAEAIVGRSTERLYDPAGLAAVAPRDGDVPAPSPTPRPAMLAAATRYLDAMQSHSIANVVHTDDCVRLENGHKAGASCIDGLDKLVQISAVAHRRVALVDERSGTMIVAGMFLRPPGALMPNGQPWKRNLFLNLVQVDGGKVAMISGAMHYLDAEDPETTGWPDDPASTAAP